MCAAFGNKLKSFGTSSNRFRSADKTFESMGQVKLPLATPYGKVTIPVTLDVVPADIPALLDMDVLDGEFLIADIVANRLTKRVKYRDKTGSLAYYDEWQVPLFRSKGNHVYAETYCPTNVLFTRSQLHKLQRQFFHPYREKLFNLLRRSKPEETSPETLTVLQDLTKRCDPCQRIQSAPTSFRASFGAENVHFNERILLDIVSIEEKPVLHIVLLASYPMFPRKPFGRPYCSAGQ